MLTREAILSLDDLPREEVFIPEWKGSVFVRALNGAERDKLERMISKDTVSRAAIVAFCVVDSKGDRLFTEKDVEKLASKNGSALEKIVSAALRFNLLTDESLEAGKDECKRSVGGQEEGRRRAGAVGLDGAREIVEHAALLLAARLADGEDPLHKA